MSLRSARSLASLALLALLTAVAMGAVAWPGRALWPWSDSLATALQMDHMHRAMLGLEDWRRGGLAWPLDGAVTQVDWLGGPALLSLPLHLLGLDPLDEHALVCGLGMLLGALACQLVARVLFGRGPHTLIAAVVGGFHPIALGHLPYANLAHGELGVLGALALGLGMHRDQPRLAALGGLLIGGAGWFGFYQAAHAAVIGGVVALVGALACRPGRRTPGAAAGGALVGLLTLAPVIQVYMEFQRLHDVRSEAGALVAESWDLAWPLRFGEGSTPGGGGAASGGMSLAGLGLILGLGLALSGLSRLRRADQPRWPLLSLWGVALGAMSLALGPELVWAGKTLGIPGPASLLALVPGMDGLRAPVRWLGVAAMALGVLAAGGAQGLAGRAGRLRPAFLLGITVTLAGLMVRPVSSEPRSSLNLQPVYGLIEAARAGGAVLDLLPPGGRTDLCACHLGHRLRAAMLHRRPLVGGLYARRVQALVLLNRMTQAWPAPETVELLRRVGVSLVVEHAPAREIHQEGVQCESANGHRLCALEPWPRALVDPDDLEVVDAPPVDALRWRLNPKASGALELQCDGQTLSFPLQVWRTMTAMQRGTSGPALEIQLGQRCAQSVRVAGHAPVLLRAKEGARPWPSR